ncbi:MAG TPA: hypothetical protein VGY96_08200 [Streptosporangiaceae bacterium]|jgi:hypothetical protein|nr:hypothetical protein [Streptosporangiaceae bacterium]
MSQSAPDLYRPLRSGRRYAILIGVAVLTGLIAGPAAAAFSPATVTSTALVALQTSGGCHRSTAAIADQGSLLDSTDLGPSASGVPAKGQVQVESLTPSVISVSATAGTAAQAEAAANAEADNYIASADSAADPVDPAADPAGQAAAQLLQPATTATGTAGSARLLDGAGLGLLSGLLAGVAAALLGRRFSILR